MEFTKQNNLLQKLSSQIKRLTVLWSKSRASSDLFSQKRLLPISWAVAIIAVLMLSSSFNDKSLHFFGIAGEPEQSINFQYPVEVVQFFVTEGAEVKQGQNILAVKRHELDTKLIRINQEIRQFQLQKQETTSANNSQLTNLTAKKETIIADMDYQIHALEQRLKINRDMVRSISGRRASKKLVAGNTELNDLKRKRHYSVAAVQAQIDHLVEQLSAANRPIDIQINELHTRRDSLQQQNVSLKVKAQFDGRIGSINFKPGELISPFQAIMSVHSRIPRYVKGYIHEFVLNDVKVGQKVWIKSIAFDDEKNTLAGVVESLGNRIVEYPERLKKNPMVQAWGREVVVRMNSLKNPLLFGEKVQVFLEPPDNDYQVANIINTAVASIHGAFAKPSGSAILSSNPAINAGDIEASGLLWNAKTDHYLLISDETSNQQLPLFIMDQKGVVSVRLSMQNMSAQSIDDLESISSDGDRIYILSSLSHNKKDRLKNKRKLLTRFNYQQQAITELQQIDLYKVLGAIKDSRSTPAKLALFLDQAITDHSMDIESHFVKNNTLYLGFKSPFTDASKALIIKINDLEALFAGVISEAQIWKSLNLADPETGEPMQLSDMLMVGDDLFITGVSRSSSRKSVLWRYLPKQQTLENIQQFPGLKAEGISYHPEKSMFTVVFDNNGNTPSSYLTIPYSLSSPG